jgi:hypothetical protein
MEEVQYQLRILFYGGAGSERWPRRPEDATQRDEKTQDSPNDTAKRRAPIQLAVIESTTVV